MQSVLKDISAVIAAAVVIAHATGQSDLLWNQLYAMRKAVIKEMKQDWDVQVCLIKRPAKG